MTMKMMVAGLVAGMMPLLAGAGDGAAVATAHPVEMSVVGGTAPAAVPPAPAVTAPVSQTELWLQVQAAGRAASNQVQQATPTERELSFQRLLESYKHPIPESFDREPVSD
ncbi:MAG: DUF3613 domain-containing protein [Porticoccaceae bacterium]